MNQLFLKCYFYIIWHPLFMFSTNYIHLYYFYDKSFQLSRTCSLTSNILTSAKNSLINSCSHSKHFLLHFQSPSLQCLISAIRQFLFFGIAYNLGYLTAKVSLPIIFCFHNSKPFPIPCLQWQCSHQTTPHIPDFRNPSLHHSTKKTGTT